MKHFGRFKLLALFMAILLPVSFFIYFEIKKQNTGVRIKQLPVLSKTAIPAFHLLAHNGDSVTNDDLTDKIVVVDFIFTRCRGICPKMSSQMKSLQEYIANQPNLKSEYLLLSHTVDPYFDSISVLNDYATAYGANDDLWLFLTGDKPQLYALAKDFYKLPTIETPEDPENLYTHSERFILLDKEGYIRGYYDGTDSTSVKELMKDIVMLDLAYQIESTKITKGR